jgi:hypothetical protein
MSYFIGFTKIVTSSVYKEVLMPLILGEILVMTPFSTAMCRIFWRGRMKSIGSITWW